MSLRSEVNGTSPTRSNRLRRASVIPTLASATRNAASVGSPWMLQVPSSSSTKTASLDRLPPPTTACASSRSTWSSRGWPSTSSSPSGR